jgi:hypothetical protein
MTEIEEPLSPKRPETTDVQRSRNVFGTLTTEPKTKFLGTLPEQDAILKITRAHCPSITKLILQQELHKKGDNKGNIHYHFLVCTANPMSRTKLDGFRSALSTWHPGRHDVQFAKSVKAVELYVFKEHVTHDPYTEGYTGAEIASIANQAVREHPPVVKTTNANKYEEQILEQVTEFMNVNHYKINYYTRQLHAEDGRAKRFTDQPSFFEKLTKETNMLKEYGQRGYKLIQEYIKDANLHALPYFKPNKDYISFNNAVYCFTEGKRYEPTDPVVKDITPIRHFYQDFPQAAPMAYLFLIRHHGWSYGQFLRQYGAMFTPKQHRDLCMYLWGPPVTGKTMFYIPLIEVYGDMVGNFTKDGKFSLALLPDKLLAVLDEIDIWSEKDIALDLTKKLLEGTEFTVARKNRDPGVVQPIHTFISTNTKPPEAVDEKGNRSYHIEAVLSRIHPYETRELDSRDEDIARTVAKDEAAAWAILCTQKHPYIVVPPDYFPSV